MKVLLAEDSPSMMAFTSAIIKNSGHDVVPARDGREALSLYQSAKPDLVLLDIEMPHFNGLEVAENIRSMDQKVWVPIIFLTSYQDDAYLQRGIGCGGDDYLTKPVSQIVLNAMHRLSEMQQRLLNVTRELSETNSKLHYSSITDPLTGCYNRLFLEERMVEEWEFCSCKEQELSIMIVDLDNFKTINDSNGHHAGDECLVRIAEIFKSQLNTSREKICRYGGDEFVMILPGSN